MGKGWCRALGWQQDKPRPRAGSWGRQPGTSPGHEGGVPHRSAPKVSTPAAGEEGEGLPVTENQASVRVHGHET